MKIKEIIEESKRTLIYCIRPGVVANGERTYINTVLNIGKSSKLKKIIFSPFAYASNPLNVVPPGIIFNTMLRFEDNVKTNINHPAPTYTVFASTNLIPIEFHPDIIFYDYSILFQTINDQSQNTGPVVIYYDCSIYLYFEV